MAQISSASPSRSVSILCDTPNQALFANFNTDISSNTSNPSATELSPCSVELVMISNLAPIPMEDISLVDRVSHLEHQSSRPHSPSIYSVPTGSPSEATPIDNDSVLNSLPSEKYFKWFVVFNTFVINFIIEGLQFSVSVLLIPFKNEFNSNTSDTGWVIGMFLGMPHLCAPVASLLVNRFGCRNITIAGALLAFLGVMLSSQVNSLLMLFTTYGVIGGFGLGMIDVSASVILTQYFDKKLSFVSGVSVCGGGIGTLVLVPSINILINAYGWRQTNVMCAGIYLFIILCGISFRPLPVKNTSDNSCNSIPVRTVRELPVVSPNEKWHTRLKKYAKGTAKSVVEPLTYKGFIIYATSNFIFYLFNDIPYVYPLDSADIATWFIVIIGNFNVLGQIGIGWLGDKKRFRIELLYATIIELCGLCVLIMPLVQEDKILVSVVAGSFGFFLSGNYALTNSILKQQIPGYTENEAELTKEKRKELNDKFSTSYGLLLFVQGIGNLFGPPLAGSFVDRNGKPDVAYYLGGVAIIVSGAIMNSVPLYDYFYEKKQENNNCDTSNQEPINET